MAMEYQTPHYPTVFWVGFLQTYVGKSGKILDFMPGLLTMLMAGIATKLSVLSIYVNVSKDHFKGKNYYLVIIRSNCFSSLTNICPCSTGLD
jgi:hypothetical protein